MARTSVRYKDLSLFIDINLKNDSIQEIFFSGASEHLQKGIEELNGLLIDRPVGYAFTLSRSQLKHDEGNIVHLPLWMIHQALYDYLGEKGHLSKQNDLLCLCYGIGMSDLKKEILADSDFDLPQLIAKTKATSACASCLPSITKALKDLRSKHGIIKGEKHSRTRVDKNGNWIKINDLYPADLLIALDDLKMQWMKREKLESQFQLEIMNIEGHHLTMKVTKLDGTVVDQDRAHKILQALTEYVTYEMNTLFFFTVFV